MRAAAGMPRSVSAMKMMRHMKMEMQRAAQKRERGIGKTHDKTDQIKSFPVHRFTSFNLTSFSFASLNATALKLGLTHYRRDLLLLRTQHMQQLFRQLRRF